MLEPLRVIHRDPSLVLSSWRNIFFQTWLDDGEASHVEKMYLEHLRFVNAHEDKKTFSMAHLTMPQVRPPAEGLRDVLGKHSKEVTPRVRAGVTVIEADGFAGAMIRGIVSSLTLLSRGPRQEVQKTPLLGLRYLVSQRSGDPSPIDPAQLFAVYQAAVGG